MAAEFVSLADWLRPPAAPTAEPAAELVRAHAAALAVETDAALARTPSDAAAGDDSDAAADDVVRALRDARLFGARLADAFDDAAARLVRELAADVLARELRLGPCDLAAIVRRVAERVPVVRVRVAPEDVSCIRGVAVVADAALAAGDAIVELAGGALDARLGVRLAAVLEAFA